MKEQIRELFRSEFFKNAVIMVTGTAGAQIVTLLLAPVITRLYGPEAYGVMGTFSSIMNVVGSIAALSYPIAIVLPRKDENAKGLAHISIRVTLTITLVTLVIIYFFGKQIIHILNLQEISSYVFLIPIIILFTGFMKIIEQWLIRTKQFSINARSSFYQSLLINSSKTALGFVSPQASVLVFLTSLNNGVRALFMTLLSKSKNYNFFNKNNVSLRNLAKKYRDFPLFRAPESFINAITEGLPVLMLSGFFGPISAGFYSIGKTTLSIPERLIGKSIGDVFYPSITTAVINEEDVSSLIKKATLLLIIIGMIPFGLIIAFGPYLFSFVFGDEWSTAGEYARWIALWSYTRFVNRPSIRSLPALNALRFNLIYTLIMFIINVLSLTLGYYIFSNDIMSVFLFGSTGALMNLAIIFITLRIAKIKN